MSSESLDAAYALFVASLLAGGFGPPPDGEWPAELIAAHVARNNDLIAEVADQVAAGEEVGYDNAAGVDTAVLARYAAEAGGAAGLAREVERSAARLERARDALGERAQTPVHALITDNGRVVRDGPVPIGELIQANVTVHLDLHLEQLKALELAAESDPPGEFDSYQIVLLERSPTAPVLDDAAAEALQRRHLGHFAKLSRAGMLMAPGPIGGDPAIAGICIYRAGTAERARALAEDDPAVRAGQFTIRVMSWLTARDAISWP